jgi:hypothetical protein
MADSAVHAETFSIQFKIHIDNLQRYYDIGKCIHLYRGKKKLYSKHN